MALLINISPYTYLCFIYLIHSLLLDKTCLHYDLSVVEGSVLPPMFRQYTHIFINKTQETPDNLF